jgi:hypothetical protein
MAGKKVTTVTYYVYEGDGYTISTIPLSHTGKLIAKCATYKEANALVERLMEEDDAGQSGETNRADIPPAGVS